MIILYGGSFNPPTLAHYGVVKLLNEVYNPDKIILMPVGCKYPKPNLHHVKKIWNANVNGEWLFKCFS